MHDAVHLVTFEQYCLVAVISFIAAVLGGVTGYGTGLILPPVLLPIVGPEAVVPIISLSALMTNASRLIAFRDKFDVRNAIMLAACALPTCVAGAFVYTVLSGKVVTIIIGLALIILVPLRRLVNKAEWTLATSGVAVAGSGYGLLVGATSGSGVVLLSILLAAGLRGSAVIATDAGISLFLGLAKTAVFQTAGALPASAWIMAILIGGCATPGAFLAKRLTADLPIHIHTSILDGVVMLGGALLVIQACCDGR
ncbi:sulfite exporter TauE/SafE family protein [Bradyrhizobium sp. ARR65]|uniref:sulfite exporter TauE/SafE family protein n=1 Tax=Bradyrhizobium sp. ARR65 TaxID=1040989 RepID=UPI000467AA85|nr:sulfite exporter TauE/SafE family protein [Bradyrhizobium sp. ARR65]